MPHRQGEQGGVDGAPDEEQEPIRNRRQVHEPHADGEHPRRDERDRQVPPPEIAHVEPDPGVVVPVHEKAVAQRDTRDVGDRRGPIPQVR